MVSGGRPHSDREARDLRCDPCSGHEDRTSPGRPSKKTLATLGPLLPGMNNVLGRLFECFYEKVVKVKADVAAILISSFPSCIDLRW
jgi:hypothetical protein